MQNQISWPIVCHHFILEHRVGLVENQTITICLGKYVFSRNALHFVYNYLSMTYVEYKFFSVYFLKGLRLFYHIVLESKQRLGNFSILDDQGL